MEVYVIRSPSESLARVLPFLAFFLVWFILFSQGGLWFIALPIVAIFLFAISWAVGREIYELRVEYDGAVTFRRLRGDVTIPLPEIIQVQGVRKVDAYKNVSWEMRVRTMHETLTVEFFGQAMEFVDDLRALKPGLRVDGEWPVLNPWDARLGDSFEP